MTEKKVSIEKTYILNAYNDQIKGSIEVNTRNKNLFEEIQMFLIKNKIEYHYSIQTTERNEVTNN